MENLNLLLTKNKFWQYCQKLIYADRLSQKTVKRKLASLKKFCQWAVEKGWLRENPFTWRETKPIRKKLGLAGQIGVLTSLIVGGIILQISLAKIPAPVIPEPISLPPIHLTSENFAAGQILSQTSGFGGIEQIRGLTASESAVLANLAKEGRLVLPESLGIEAKEITLKTTDAYDGNITLNPDGQGVLNLLFEGQSPKRVAGVGGFVNIQNANLKEGHLIAATVANNNQGYNFLQFRGGTTPTERFTVASGGNLFTSGSLTTGSGQIASAKNLIFSPQDQPILVLAPKTSRLAGNLAVGGLIYDGGLGVFGVSGQRLPTPFDFTSELTIEFEFLTGKTDLNLDFNINKANNKFYRASWQTNGQFTLKVCQPACSTIGSVADYPFDKDAWHHGRLHINQSRLTWELDYSAQKNSAPVASQDLPLLSSGYLNFSLGFAAINNLQISSGGNPILTSGDAKVGGNMEVAGSVRLGELSDQSASTHICYNVNGDLAECSADYAEWYPVDSSDSSDLLVSDAADSANETDFSDISGTLVSITNIPNPVDDPTARYMAEPSSKPYDNNLLGVLADPTLGANGKRVNESYQPLVLAGRVPVKVSSLNGPIEVGNPITSSEIMGVGMRATEAGAIIGTALEPLPKPENDEFLIDIYTILVLINPGWWEPDSQLVNDQGRGEVAGLGEVNSLTIERLRTTGQEETANQLIAQSLKVAGEATIAGQLTAESRETKTAKISHLIADEIKSETITTLEDQFGNLSAKVEELESEGKEGPEGQEEPEPAEEANVPSTSDSFENSALVAQVNQFIKELQEFHLDSLANPVNDLNISKDIVIENYQLPITNYQLLSPDFQFPSLTVIGPTSLGQTTIAGNLLVDSTLQLGVNSINSLNNTLYLQNYGFGGLDILAGKVKIDNQGNLAVAGSVEIAQDLRVKKSLFANLIKPLEGKEVLIEGDLTAKAGTFSKIVIAASADSPTLRVENSKPEGFPSAAVTSNTTAGTAVLPAGETELTITNDSITDNSLIYITPLSSTENKVLFVKVKQGLIECLERLEYPGVSTQTHAGGEQECLSESGYFIVAIDEAVKKDIEFNWWVIN